MWRPAILASLAWSVLACASAPWHWEHPEKQPEAWTAEDAECLERAERATSDLEAMDRIRTRCMWSRGWVKVDDWTGEKLLDQPVVVGAER